MVKKIFLTLLFLTVYSCDVREREQLVTKRENELTIKEQELLLKEKSLVLKEKELKIKEKTFISTSDTGIVLMPEIEGIWHVKMVCSETSCAGSAIGDTKIETWSFMYDGDHLMVKALVGRDLVRIYTGTVQENRILLKGDVDSKNPSAAKLIIRLNITGNKSMEGHREIFRLNDCRIIYDLQLSK